MSGKKEFPRRGEIYWVNLEPTIGVESKKIRPGLIISNDIGNEVSNLVMVAPITSKVKHIYPFEVQITIHKRQAKIMLNQCRAIDKLRLGDKIHSIDSDTMKAVEKAIKLVFGLT